MGLLYSGGFIIRRIFASEIWGAYFRNWMVSFLAFSLEQAHPGHPFFFMCTP